MATVEYESEELGSITKVFVIPYDRGQELVRRKIIEQFPHDLFYSRYLMQNPPDSSSGAYVHGRITINFDDYFYDVQEMMTRDDIEAPGP